VKTEEFRGQEKKYLINDDDDDCCQWFGHKLINE